MITELKTSLRILFILIILFCTFAIITNLLCQIFFFHESNGSLISYNGKIIGAKNIGQNFTYDEYFHSRPSQVFSSQQNLLVSSFRNIGTNSKEFKGLMNEAISAQKERYGTARADLLTYSGSGLDPHITQSSALIQVPRVAKSRNLKENRVRVLVEKHSMYSIYADDKLINVLELNLALDTIFGNAR